MLFVVSGPSGCGKTTLAGRTVTDLEKIEFSVSHTTRPKRTGEKEGRDYYFTGEQEFREMIREGRMLEWAEVHGHLYGTSRREIKIKSSQGDVLLDIDIQGAAQVRKKVREACFVFILPPHYRELKRRLEQRGSDDPDSIRRRLETAREEIGRYSDFDYIVVNDDLEKASVELNAVITAARCRLPVRQKEITPILASFSQE